MVYLKHYGVKGMKWGVRKKQQSDEASDRRLKKDFGDNWYSDTDDYTATDKQWALYRKFRDIADGNGPNGKKVEKQFAKQYNAMRKKYAKPEDGIKQKDVKAFYKELDDLESKYENVRVQAMDKDILRTGYKKTEYLLRIIDSTT